MHNRLWMAGFGGDSRRRLHYMHYIVCDNFVFIICVRYTHNAPSEHWVRCALVAVLSRTACCGFNAHPTHSHTHIGDVHNKKLYEVGLLTYCI